MRHLLRSARLLTASHVLALEGQSRNFHPQRFPLLIKSTDSRCRISYRTKVWTSAWPSIGSIDNCIYGHLTAAIKKHGDQGKIAMINAENPEHKYSFKDMLEVIKSVEGYLHENGFQAGDVVTSVLSNCIEFPVVFIATIGRGGAFSGASAQFSPEEIARQLNDNKTKIVVTNEKYLEKVIEAVKQVPLVTKIICIREPGATGSLPSHPNVVDWADVLKNKTPLPKPTHKLEETAVLPYSSGTTGVPKGVQLSHISFLTAVIGYTNHSINVIRPKVKEVMGDFEESSNLVLYLPFYHVYGKVTLMAAILKGETCIVMKRMDPTILYQSIEKYRPWSLYMVPPITLMLVKDPNAAKYDLSSIRYAVSGAAPLGKDLAGEFQKKYPKIFLTQAYGMSETALCSFLPPCEVYGNYEHVGRVAPEFEAKIIDLSTGAELEENQTGELCLRGQALMKGYLNRPEATKDVIDEDGWFHTGDVGFFNGKGEMHIVDRIKELIKVKGLQVAPAELESLLSSCPRILDVAVIGVPNEESGEVPRAFVVKRDPTLTEAEVKKLVADKLAKYKRLEGGVFFVDQIPKSPAGKILRRELRSSTV